MSPNLVCAGTPLVALSLIDAVAAAAATAAAAAVTDADVDANAADLAANAADPLAGKRGSPPGTVLRGRTARRRGGGPVPQATLTGPNALPRRGVLQG